jgi:hypothetical protein
VWYTDPFGKHGRTCPKLIDPSRSTFSSIPSQSR